MLKLKLQYFGHLMCRTDSLERPWCWERLRAGGEGDNRGWDGWMASLTQWTWVWVSSRSWWWTGRAGVLQSMGLQRVGHDWVTETKPYSSIIFFVFNWSVKTHAKHCKLNQIPFRNRWAATIKPNPGKQTFLVVQWIGIRLPRQGTLVRSLVQEDSTCSRATKPIGPNYWGPST